VASPVSWSDPASITPRVFSQELCQHLQLVFVDLRHFAAASDPSFTPDRISSDTYADDIEQVRQTLGLGDVVVVGHSIHALIALAYARRYPGHVRGVVAVGADPLGDATARARLWEAEASDERKEILKRQLAELTTEVRATLSPADVLVREYVASGPTLWFDPGYDCSWLWDGVVADVPTMDRLFRELFQTYDLDQGPGEITTPVLIAQGRYDYGAPLQALGRAPTQTCPAHLRPLREKRSPSAARGAGAVRSNAPDVDQWPRGFERLSE
jgi:proline iminopeptidase